MPQKNFGTIQLLVQEIIGDEAYTDTHTHRQTFCLPYTGGRNFFTLLKFIPSCFASLAGDKITVDNLFSTLVETCVTVVDYLVIYSYNLQLPTGLIPCERSEAGRYKFQ